MRALLCRAELAMSGERADPREVVAWLERADAASTALQPRCSDTAANTAALWQLRCAASIIAGDADAARSAAVEALPLLLPRQRAATLFDALAWLAGRTGQTALGAQLLEQADRWYHEHRERRQFEARLRDLAQARRRGFWSHAPARIRPRQHRRTLRRQRLPLVMRRRPRLRRASCLGSTASLNACAVHTPCGGER
jgi:hypothetical protein